MKNLTLFILHSSIPRTTEGIIFHCLILLFFSIFFAVISAKGLMKNIKFVLKGKIVDGQVEKVHVTKLGSTGRYGKGKKSKVQLQCKYEYNGKICTGSVHLEKGEKNSIYSYADYKEGERVKLYVLPESPRKICIASLTKSSVELDCFILAVSVIIFLFAFYILLTN